jgi:hypothetical protein
MLSPLLWSLVVDDLLWGLNDYDYYTTGYADDIAIPINRKFPQTVRDITNSSRYSPAVAASVV